jgi:hypothetical protein
MNHPTPEEMMDHLYGESTPAQQAAVKAHLAACEDCRNQASTWRSAMKTLDSWPLPSAGILSLTSVRPILRWAAAAAVLAGVLGFGFVVGRGASPDQDALQAALRREVATQVAAAMDRERSTLVTELRAAATASASQETRQLMASLAQQLDERRQADAEVFYTAIEQVDARNAQSISRLRRDLSTVALVADARLVDTQEQINQLAQP